MDSSNSKFVIVALTAKTMRVDREKYLESGMNDYLAKPLRNKERDQVLNRWLNANEADFEKVVPVSEASNESQELALLDLLEIESIFSDRDADTIASLLSHSIKGSSANYGAARLRSVVGALE